MKEDKYKYIPNYERANRLADKMHCPLLRNFVVFPSEVARTTYNKAVKLGIVSGKKWKN